jgi:M6 family metalloprotease-like protein
MKYFLFLLGILTFCPQCAQKTQNPQLSYLGAQHTPKGHLHTLVIFIRYEDKDLYNGYMKEWTNSDTLPQMVQGEINDWMDAKPETVGTPNHTLNISDFYYKQSNGKFTITGDIFPIQVPIKYIPENGGNFFNRQSQMNEKAIQWIATHYPNFDWSKYDNRKNNPNFAFDNSNTAADSVLDYVLFVHRDFSGSTGMGASGAFAIPKTPYRIASGYTSIKSPGTAIESLIYFKHEFAHNLYNCPHYLGANTTVGDKCFVQAGWGLMAQPYAPFVLANAWEKWWLAWAEPQNVRYSGTYTLKDMATQHDAIRIQIPGTQDVLWIENHQKVSPWDTKFFYYEQRQSAKGIYMYVVAEPGFDRNKGALSPFTPHHCNLIKMMNGEGNYDMKLRGDSVVDDRKEPVWKKGRNNPISGHHDLQSFRWDLNHDNKVEINANHGNMDAKPGELVTIWTLEQEGDNPTAFSRSFTGDEWDAFDLGDEIGLSGIVPILNYPVYDIKNQTLAPYYLNGITIKIAGRNVDGSYVLDIKFDDYEIRSSQRWCGELLLPAKESDKVAYLSLKKNVQLLLDLSGMPNRSTFHPQTQTYINPTHLRVQANNAIKITAGSKLILDQYSKIDLEGNAQIIIEKGGELLLKATSELEMNAKTKITVLKGGKLTVEKGATLRQLEGSYLGQEKGAKVRL